MGQFSGTLLLLRMMSGFYPYNRRRPVSRVYTDLQRYVYDPTDFITQDRVLGSPEDGGVPPHQGEEDLDEVVDQVDEGEENLDEVVDVQVDGGEGEGEGEGDLDEVVDHVDEWEGEGDLDEVVDHVDEGEGEEVLDGGEEAFTDEGEEEQDGWKPRKFTKFLGFMLIGGLMILCMTKNKVHDRLTPPS